MGLIRAILGSSNSADYAGRESATARKARLAEAKAVRDRAASVARHRRLGTKEQRKAAERGWF